MGPKRLWFCLVSAAAFFVTYDCTKSLLGAGGPLAAPHMAPVTHMLAASLGETVSLPALRPSRFICVLFESSPLLQRGAEGSILSVFSVCALVFLSFADHYAELAWGGVQVCSSDCGLSVPARGDFLGTLQISLLPVDLPTFPAQAPRRLQSSLWDSDL